MSSTKLHAGPAPGVPLDLTFENRGDRLIGLGIVNGILILLTFGIYSFWAKTEVRRKLWSFVRINGEPLNYTGTGRELMLGFIVAFGVVLLPLLILFAAGVVAVGGDTPAGQALNVALYAFIFYLIGNAIYRATRYRLSRSRWRGIRGWLAGNPNSYAWTHFWTVALPLIAFALLVVATAWSTGPEVGGILIVGTLLAALWILPWRSNLLQARITNDMRFGNTPLRYTGNAAPLYRSFALAWFGAAIAIILSVVMIYGFIYDNNMIEAWETRRRLPSASQIAIVLAGIIFTILLIGVIMASYRAAQYRHFARHTLFENGRFKMSVTGKGLAWIFVTNWLLIIFVFIATTGLASGLLNFAGLIDLDAQGPQAPTFSLLVANLLIIASIVVAMTAVKTFTTFRWSRYLMSRLSFTGTADVERILQSQADDPRLGEGLAQVFDIDGF